MTEKLILSVNHLTVAYGVIRAIKDVALSVPVGSIVSLIQPPCKLSPG
jgi:ABC-type branched-subunit amino acid transport system ATPase component